MALFRCGGEPTNYNGYVLGVFYNYNQTARMPYTGTNGISYEVSMATVTEGAGYGVKTDTEVKASSSTSPLYTHIQGNQNVSIYYDNGDIVMDTTNVPLCVIWNTI